MVKLANYSAFVKKNSLMSALNHKIGEIQE